MRQPLPEFPPLFPPGEWWRHFFKSRLEGISETQSVIDANAGSGIKSRDWMRFGIEGGLKLTIPVQGGASSLKNRNASSWRLSSEAEREIRKIESTLATVYGRQPYFNFVRDDIFESLRYGCVDVAAETVCGESFKKIVMVLGLEDENLLRSLADALEEKKSLVRVVKMETERGFESGKSILDAIFKLGPDAIFALMPPF